jgi:hypothetical protein
MEKEAVVANLKVIGLEEMRKTLMGRVWALITFELGTSSQKLS